MTRITKGFAIAVCILYTAIVLLPFFWLIFASLKSNWEIFEGPFSPPGRVMWENYARAWTEANVGRYFANSVFVTVISVFFIVLLSAMATYAITRLEFRINTFILYLFVGGLMIPFALVLGPLFLFLYRLGIVDSYIGLIPVYIAYSFPFTVFVLTPFFQSIPSELEEAAFIDGATAFGVFWRIALPLVKPGLAIVTIFNILGIWNEYVLAYSIIGSEELRTLPLGLGELARAQQYQADWAALFAALVIVILPIFCAYILFQKWLQKGIMGGALK